MNSTTKLLNKQIIREYNKMALEENKKIRNSNHKNTKMLISYFTKRNK